MTWETALLATLVFFDVARFVNDWRKKRRNMGAIEEALAKLEAEVAADSDVEASAIKVIDGIADEVKKAVADALGAEAATGAAAVLAARVTAAVDKIAASRKALAAAVAAAPAPVTSPSPVPPPAPAPEPPSAPPAPPVPPTTP